MGGGGDCFRLVGGGRQVSGGGGAWLQVSGAGGGGPGEGLEVTDQGGSRLERDWEI